MPVCRPGLHAVPLLLGLLLLGLSPVPGGRLPGLGLLAPLTVGLPGREAEKTGVCPQLQADQNCTQECQSDAQCADNLKCCQAGCATICHLPDEKQGSCPHVNTDFPQLGLCQDQCKVDSQCPGLLKCCYNGCGKVSCITPVF
ncbi:WAP four-disulfide core domain protein 2 isoform X1 [Panthera pardus]|uniref:WAP four-disulfide core domain protein 2 n=1 Tax=Panthera pardus TaxID=9691 RepID=A0A9W2UI04_PANPR|nr:WAP four-disulfide core domain protein 2 isoform X1 [Panthera leo]XP_042836231.1 WAP four-disulfide core domain protein 2 isoform X1 [Panthera tigris]XP_049506648.1 WAP four-disulfide core domain protein 2 isoform X1 [Panthera uncia]XP_049506649.1 WAP four-disulfide core domain protein 2 isoform X1 [Panthera uncia]XP_053746187.1 WAP four-disulfide core domain protein 2 isoform X1 [Panthera pardus]XP_058541756.1 WAP four-disulfide core domain protein 2 isoform X1 [Neofelis nebulosa]XP_06047